MFDTFAGLLSSIPTFLFPVFASYKALKTSDPALLTPWLMYWVVLACALFVESWTAFILIWVPFYSWIRLTFLLYLILPQTQGANVLYRTHVHSFLEKNEHVIDEFISSAHDRAKTAGVKYLKQIIEFVKENLFGFPPNEQPPPTAPTKLGYTQSLMARFNLPNSRPILSGSPMSSATGPVADFYSLLTSAVNSATSRDSSSRSLTFQFSPSASSAERLSYISAQRERLAILLSALEKEARALESDLSESSTPSRVPGMLPDSISSDSDENVEKMRASMSELVKSHSEVDFEKIEAESTFEGSEYQHEYPSKAASATSWLPWNWRAQIGEKQVDMIMNNVELTEDKENGASTGS